MNRWAIEKNQSKRALDESIKSGFFLRKKPLEGCAPGYSCSGFSIAARRVQTIESTFLKGLKPNLLLLLYGTAEAVPFQGSALSEPQRIQIILRP
jgi:hypothetical protein